MFSRAMCVASVIGALLGVTAAPTLADEPLTAQQIRRLAPGTFHAVVKGKFQLIVTLSRDGARIGKGSGLTDRGRWSVRDNELCITMPNMTRGFQMCSAVVADNGWYKGRNVSFRKL